MSVLEIWGAEYQEQVRWGVSVLHPRRLYVQLHYTTLVYTCMHLALYCSYTSRVFPSLWLVWIYFLRW